ncbi:MAG: choice-of-anchor J domain-containing protein, partial [Thermoplasmatota archaeon]
MKATKVVWVCMVVLVIAAVPIPPSGLATNQGMANASGYPIFLEGFEEAWPPDGWAITTIDPAANQTNGNWSQAAEGSFPTAVPFEGHAMARYNSFLCTSGKKARLETPLLSPAGHAALTLGFWMYHSSYANGSHDAIVVQLAPDGATWVNLTSIDRYGADTGWRHHDIELPLDTVENQFRVGFLGISDFGGNMYLDHVTVIAPYETDVGITAVPHPSAGFIQANTSVTVVATVHNFGSLAQSAIPVVMAISGPHDYWYDATEILDGPLPADGNINVSFGSYWVVPSVPGTYTLVVFTDLAGDQDGGNNALTRTLTVYWENQLYESFESWLPEGWAVVDNSFSHWEQDNVFHVPHSYNWSAYAGRDSNGSADCWLITPRLALQEDDLLSFWYATGTSGTGTATLEVMLSTGSSQTDVDSFVTQLWSATISSTAWTEQQIALAPHGGQLAYIGFHVVALDDYMDSLLLDDVYGPMLWQPVHDVAPVGISHPES